MIPQNESIRKLALLLEEKRKRDRIEEESKQYEKIKDILIFLAFFGTCIFAPKATILFKPLLPRPEFDGWKKFNKKYLNWSLERLAKEKIIKIDKENDKNIIELTNKGENKIFRYAIEQLEIIKPNTWDNKWRIILYDISNKKRVLADKIRNDFKRLGFLAIQKSTHIYPYPCEKEIEFLRQYYNLNKEITLVTACSIEREDAYKTFFGLN